MLEQLLAAQTGRELRLIMCAIARRKARVISAQFDKREHLDFRIYCPSVHSGTDYLRISAEVFAHGLKFDTGAWLSEDVIRAYYVRKAQALVHFAYEVD